MVTLSAEARRRLYLLAGFMGMGAVFGYGMLTSHHLALLGPKRTLFLSGAVFVAFAVSQIGALCLGKAELSRVRRGLLLSLIAVFVVEQVNLRSPYAQTFPVTDFRDWTHFYISPDSWGYVEKPRAENMRPPGYALFSRLVTLGTAFDYTTMGIPADNAPIESDLSSPFLRIVWGQKLLILIGFVLLFWQLASLISGPITAIAFLCVYRWGGFSLESSGIMSEPLTQGWALLAFACMVGYVSTMRVWYLYLCSLFAAFMFLTRPAGVYGMGIPLVATLYGLYYSAGAWKSGRAWRYFARPVIPLFLGLVLCILPGLLNYFRGSEGFEVSVFRPITNSAFSLYLAKEEDQGLMNSERARTFFTKALEAREREYATLRQVKAPGEPSLAEYLSTNIYKISLHTAGEVMKQFPENPGPWYGNILREFNDPILERHSVERVGIAIESFKQSQTVSTRLDSWLLRREAGFAFFATLYGCLAIIALTNIRKPLGAFLFTLLGCHLGHLAIACFWEIPHSRLVYSTEYMVPLAVLVGVYLLVSWLSKTLLLMKLRCMNDQPPCTTVGPVTTAGVR